VATRLERAGVDWMLVGSAARALLGFAVRPVDLDLETSGDGAVVAAEALGLDLRYEHGRGRASWRATGRIAGAPVDLSGDLAVEGPGGRLTPDLALQRNWAQSMEMGGRRVWLAPPEETLARALVSGDWARVMRFAAQAPPGYAPRTAYLGLRLSAAARAAR
jgi:hypothetical protein